MRSDMFYRKNRDSEKLDEQVHAQMYHIMMNAVEDAIRTLIDAQLECEELYIENTDDDETGRL